MPSDPVKPSEPDNQLETLLQQAQLHGHNRQWAQVIALCEQAIAHCQHLQSQPPKNSAENLARNPAKNSASLTATHPTAQPAANSGPATADQSAAALYQAKGDLFKSQGEIAQANQAYQQAVALNPALSAAQTGHEETYLSLAQQLKQAGDLAGAVRVYLRALKQQPRLYMAYNRLRYNLMRYDIAPKDPILQEIAAVCEAIVTQQPDLLPAQITLGYALTKLGETDRAIAYYQGIGNILTRRHLTASPEQVSLWQSAQRRDPDFMIIGAEKCGTTSLYQYLRQHPAVISPIEKEIDFFDMEYERGLAWYLAHFPALPNNSTWVTGETSANYLYSDVAPERVFRHFPQIKLAVILRDPIDRAVSRHSMMVRNGAESRSFEVAMREEMALIQQAISAQDRTGEGTENIPWPVLNRCRHIGNSLYYYHIQRWLALFPRKQLLVLRSEDLFIEPEKTLTQLYQAFGLTPHLEQAYPKYNAGRYRPVDGDIRQVLADFFAPHTEKLETLLGRSFGWNNARSEN